MIERERGSIKFEIVEQIGVLNTYPTGWSKEFNIVKWNDKSEKYDVRDWAPGHERMSRGVTLYEDELEKLYGFCSGIFEKKSAGETVQEQPAAAAEQNLDDSADKTAEQTDEEVPF